MFLLAFTSSNPRSRTNHPLVPAFPIRLLWKPACCSNIARIKTALIEKALIDTYKGAAVFADPVFVLWMRRNMNQ